MNIIKKYLGDRHFFKVALTLGIPIALQNLLTSSFSLIDTLMVGQLGDVALSAVGMAGQWNWLLNMIMFGICSGASVFAAQYWGAGNVSGIRKILGIALTFGVSTALIFAGLGLFAPEWVMHIFNDEQIVVTEGIKYLQIAVFSYPAVVMGNIISATLRSVERVKIPLYVSFFSAILNAILNYGFIFGALGFPEMGIKGAAIATVISSWLVPVLLIVFSALEKNILFCNPIHIFRFSFADIKLFFSKAAPVILNETLWGMGTFIFNVIFARLGYEYYAAVTILKTFENICYAFFIGLCNACCVMLGKSIGSGEVKDAIRDSRRFMILVPLAGIIIGTFVVIFRENLVALFNLDGKMGDVTMASAIAITMIYGFEVWIRNIPYIMIVGVFRSGGETTVGMFLDASCQWLIALPVTLITAFVIELPFPLVYMIMYMCEDIPKSILCILYYFTDKWIKPVTDAGKAAIKEYIEQKKIKIR